jgi:energy-coupling factor transporter ATP-binding protein EcfA2
MYLRLAFAVGAHLETETLLVDEVLAVGDARFQEKCFHKMRDVGRHGRTVLFVSHNLVAATRLCERAILIDGGKVAKDGPSHEVVSAYLNVGRWMPCDVARRRSSVRRRGVYATRRPVRPESHRGSPLREGVDSRRTSSLWSL